MAFSPKSCYLWAYNTALCAAWYAAFGDLRSARCCTRSAATRHARPVLQGLRAVPRLPDSWSRRQPARCLAGAPPGRVGGRQPPPLVPPLSTAATGRPACPLTCRGAAHSPHLLQAVEVPLKVVQTAAIMEVLHSAVGLVRSPVMITGWPSCRACGLLLRRLCYCC